jgi:dihydrofolate synthase/folylpolyglutamate synthase
VARGGGVFAGPGRPRLNASAAFARPADLAGWLAYLETLHPSAIALGLDRVRAVLARLDAPIACPVITVTGTNGKGSTAAMLEAMLRAAGYRTGLYTSPHLMRYNERVRLDGREAGDAAMLAALNAVEDARAAGGPAVPLTYFEFGTLAALWLFARHASDALVLEVGLGGRLDAVNVVDADVAIVTSVDLDHRDWLGDTRESVGREKAGIFRAGRPAICGDADPPRSLLDEARRVGARLLVAGRDFAALPEGTQWRYRGPGSERYGATGRERCDSRERRRPHDPHRPLVRSQRVSPSCPCRGARSPAGSDRENASPSALSTDSTRGAPCAASKRSSAYAR